MTHRFALTAITAACVLSGCANISNLTTLSQAPAPVAASTPVENDSPSGVNAAAPAQPVAQVVPTPEVTSPTQSAATAGAEGATASQATAGTGVSTPTVETVTTASQTSGTAGVSAPAAAETAAAAANGSYAHPVAAPGTETSSVTTPAASAETASADAATAGNAASTAAASQPVADASGTGAAQPLAGSEIASTPSPATPAVPVNPAPAPDVTAATAGAAEKSSEPFSSGPTRVSVAHIVTKADDGSKLMLTVDGTDAGQLSKGEKRSLFMEAGKHKIGGYVKTLFGYGRVTISPVEVTTTPGKPVAVTYSVTRNKPTFALQKH